MIGWLHTACYIILDPHVAWRPCFSFIQESEDVTVVVRLSTTFGFDDRVQGRFVLERFGRYQHFRLLIDGHEVTTDDDGNRVKGKRMIGAVYFPDTEWNAEFKKLKSSNTTSVRGRSTLITFPVNNLTGVHLIQVTFVYSSTDHEVAKRIAASFEDVLKDMALTSG